MDFAEIGSTGFPEYVYMLRGLYVTKKNYEEPFHGIHFVMQVSS